MNDSKNMNDMKALSINSLYERNIVESYRNRLHNPSYRHNRSWGRSPKPPLTNGRRLAFYPSMCSFSMKIITATFNNLSMIAPITLLRVTDYLKVTRLVTNCTLNGVVKYA